MKSWTLIGSYLWKDTWSRWLEQPSSWLARIFVGVLLVSVATLILVAFNLLERSVRARLEAFGLNTLVVRELLSANDSELVPQGVRGDRLSPLAAFGDKVNLRQLFTRAQSDVQQQMLVFSYAEDALPLLKSLLTPENPIVCLSDNLREDLNFRFVFSGQGGHATVKRPLPIFRQVANENVLLIPRGWAPEAERNGFLETTVFRRSETAPAMTEIVSSIRQLYTMDRRTVPQMQSPLQMVKDLEELQVRQKQWRLALAALLGLAVALVYGAIAVLEFRQNQYVTALLRSFGTPRLFLYIRQWIENAFLANVAAAAAIFTIASLHVTIFKGLGFTGPVTQLGETNPYLSSEILLVIICVNVGAFISSLPVALGLRKAVGEILN